LESSHAYSALAHRRAAFDYRAADVVWGVALLRHRIQLLFRRRPTSSGDARTFIARRDEGYGFGLTGNIVVGIIGATIASLITPLLGVNIETKLGHIIAATLGAIVLLVLVGGLRRR
jgi:uncharacterized membrane protein YeaQ/YmgE (transglycosylase-associated protein family)